MRTRRRAYAITTVVCAVAMWVTPVRAQSPSPTPPAGGAPGITAVAAILVNISDGDQILFARAARAQRAPASLTKVVTALVARDEYDLDDVVTASPLVLQTGGSDLGLEPGMKVTVRELLYALLLKSANDAGMALAANHPAGYEHFIALMNQKARALGAYNSSFRNPHGLDQIGHVSSARDMAIFTRELVADPVLTAIAGSREHTMTWKGRDRTYDHHHKLLLNNSSIIAGKTGFTNQAGHSLITAAASPAGRLVTVVMGAGDQYGDTSSLLSYGQNSSFHQAAGGGGPEGFGRLPEAPDPPGLALPAITPPDANDPRDDLRWPVLMIVLALLTATSLVRSRHRSVTSDAAVQTWLTRLAAEERRRR